MQEALDKLLTKPISGLSLYWRLAAALLIGGLVGFYTSFASPGTLDVIVSGAALLVPALLHVALNPHMRRSVAALAWAIGGALLLCGLFFLLAGPGNMPGGAVCVMLWLAPISASFAVGSSQRQRVRRKWRLSVLCGMLAWLGVGIHNLLFAIIIGNVLADPIGELLLGLAVVLFLFGFLVSVFTSLLGANLYAWLRRRDRDEHLW